MRREIYTCDVCGAETSDPTGWHSATGTTGLLFHIFERGSTRHLCGSECAHKLLSRYLEGTL
jgi:hypothetical protein